MGGRALTDRRAERRVLLVDAAFRLFGDGGEAAVSGRSVCRECGLNTRYFYESFTDTDALLGAVYDQVSAALGEVVQAAMGTAGDALNARTRAGMAAVLGFSSAAAQPAIAGLKGLSQSVPGQPSRPASSSYIVAPSLGSGSGAAATLFIQPRWQLVTCLINAPIDNALTVGVARACSSVSPNDTVWNA